jgi:hypothetical protein
MVGLVPKTRSSINNPHLATEIPNSKIDLEHLKLEDLENIEHNLDTKIPYVV